VTKLSETSETTTSNLTVEENKVASLVQTAIKKIKKEKQEESPLIDE